MALITWPLVICLWKIDPSGSKELEESYPGGVRLLSSERESPEVEVVLKSSLTFNLVFLFPVGRISDNWCLLFLRILCLPFLYDLATRPHPPPSPSLHPPPTIPHPGSPSPGSTLFVFSQSGHLISQEEM